MLPASFLVLDQDTGGVTKIELVTSTLRGLGEHLKTTIINKPTRLFDISGWRLVVNKDRLLVAGRLLKSIRLDTTFWPQDDKTLAAVFLNRGIPMAVDWIPPTPHWLLVCFQEYRNFTGHVHLVTTHGGRIFRPHLPNIYEDGRVCTGEMPVYQNLPGHLKNDVAAVSEAVLQQFASNKWNSDLYPTLPPEKIFRFSPEGKQLPLDGESMTAYYQNLRVCSAVVPNLFFDGGGMQ